MKKNEVIVTAYGDLVIMLPFERIVWRENDNELENEIISLYK